MSAFGTKKPYGDAGVQLTFPANFQKAYNLPQAYYPSDAGGAFDIMIGTDFQSKYHEEKRREAHQSVMNGLQARRTAEQKLLTGPHNYHLPKPVLGQRKFANPSNGAGGYSSARRDNDYDAPFKTIERGMEGSGMRGGVVSSLEGQQFYQKQLQNRIAQLNRINALAQGFAVQMGSQYQTDDNTKTGSVDKVQFFVYLRALLDAITEGDLSRFTFENLKEMLAMMFRFGPTMSLEDIDDMRDALDLMIVSIRDGLSEEPTIAVEPEKRQYAETLVIFTEKMRQYIGAMEGSFNLQEKDKKTLSKSLQKSLGFEKLLRKGADVASVLRQARQGNARVDEAVEDFDGGWGGDGDDGDDEDGDGRFDRPAPNREDEEQSGLRRQPFAGQSGDPNRGRFGDRTGLIVFGGPSYFGEADARADAVEDMFPQYVAPLGIAGADPNATEVPKADPDTLVEAVEAETKQVLGELDYNETDDPEAFITANYPDPSNFVKEVARGLEEKGFSKAQIAEGMTGYGLEVFSDYIAEHSGDTGPAPAQPARHSGLTALGGLAPPIYRDDDNDGQADVVPAEDLASRLGAEPPKKRKVKVAKPADKSQMLRDAGLPLTRTEMYDNYRTEAQYRELGRRLPKELGGPYNMRQGTAVKNAKARIIKLMQDNYDRFW
jgi:hypothetical protein